MPELNEPLSERELDILRLVATGAANKEIAQKLVISPNTVKVHLRNIFAKIGVASRTEATLYAVKIGLVKPAVQEIQGGPAESSANGHQARVGQDDLGTGQAFPPPKVRRRLPALPFWLMVVAALLLVIISVFIGTRVINALRLARVTPLPTVAAQATAQSFAVPRWAIMADLPSPRKGMGVIEYENVLYLVAGETSQGIDGALLRYDPQENRWSTLQEKLTPVTDVKAALIGEKIYIPGGRLANGSATDRLEVYDPRKGTWESKAPLPEPLSAYGMASFEGQLYLFGGKNGERYSASVYAYNPQTDQWTVRSSMSSPRAYPGVVESGGKIYVMGGYDGQHALDQNEAYLPNRDVSGETPWKTYASLPRGRYAMGAAQIAGLVYLLGGLDEDNRPVEKPAIQYTILSDQWLEFDPPPVAVGANLALLTLGNYMHAFGGETSEGFSAVNLTYRAIYTLTVPILINDESK